MPVLGSTRISLMPVGKRDLEKLLHDRRRHMAAGLAATERLRLVVADIDADHEVGREADEPGVLVVAGCAGLAGDGLADFLAEADARSRAAQHDAFHDRG